MSPPKVPYFPNSSSTVADIARLGMHEPPEITLDLFDLIDLTVDGRLVVFTSATVTQETEWLGSRGNQHTVRRWHGQIVTYDSRIEPGRHHTFVGRTDDYTLGGFFHISRTFARSIDIDGIGSLLVATRGASAAPTEANPR